MLRQIYHPQWTQFNSVIIPLLEVLPSTESLITIDLGQGLGKAC